MSRDIQTVSSNQVPVSSKRPFKVEVELNAQEKGVLLAYAAVQDCSESAVMRQALRVYQLVKERHVELPKDPPMGCMGDEE